jgi:hypothetical protein
MVEFKLTLGWKKFKLIQKLRRIGSFSTLFKRQQSSCCDQENYCKNGKKGFSLENTKVKKLKHTTLRRRII